MEEKSRKPKVFDFNVGVILTALFFYGLYAVQKVPVFGQESSAYVVRAGPLVLGNAVLTMVVLTVISTYMYSFSRKVGDEEKSLGMKVLSMGFVAYFITILGIFLTFVGYYDETRIFQFFLTRQFMVFLMASIAFFTLGFLKRDLKRKSVFLFLTVSGYLWFFYGLFIVGSIPYMMFGFLSFLWAPVVLISGYLFFRIGRRNAERGAYFFSFGLILLATSYLIWSLFYRTPLYNLVWIMINIALVLTLVGAYKTNWKEIKKI